MNVEHKKADFFLFNYDKNIIRKFFLVHPVECLDIFVMLWRIEPVLYMCETWIDLNMCLT